MLMLHGMQSRYGKTTSAEMEKHMRAYAEARGFEPVVISISGDRKNEQEKVARERIAKGGIAAVYGFSAGGYTAKRIKNNPLHGGGHIEYISLGATPNGREKDYPGVPHMGLPAAAAKYALLQKALNKLTDAHLVVNGKMGQKTEAAIRAYQKSRSLVVDGVAGKMTIAAIDADLSSQDLRPIG
jgi:hypothetical protein